MRYLNRFRRRLVLLLSVAAAVVACEPFSNCANMRADEPLDTSAKNDELLDRWKKIFDEASNNIRISRKGVLLAGLNKTTVINTWLQGTRKGARHGRVYLWTESGRPILVVCIFTHSLDTEGRVNIAHELHSLDSQPIQVEHEGHTWYCESAGLQWIHLEDVQAPNPNRPLRLTQMRNIARSLAVTAERLDLTTAEHELVPQPVHRYQVETALAMDGAVFIIGQATDPTVFVLIEARQNAWWIAFARSSVLPLKIERNDKQFYEFLKTTPKQGNTPFYIDFKVEVRSLEDPDVVFFPLPKK